MWKWFWNTSKWETFIENWKNATEGQKNGQFMLYTRNPFAKVLPSVTWKKVNESNKFMDLGKMAYSQNAKSMG